jgi:hypothetical protein
MNTNQSVSSTAQAAQAAVAANMNAKSAKRVTLKRTASKSESESKSKSAAVRALIDDNRKSYLYVGKQKNAEAFLVFSEKQIEVQYMLSDRVEKLKPAVHNYATVQDAARVFIKSKLPKDQISQQVLDAIVESKDATQSDFISDVIAANVVAAKAADAAAKSENKDFDLKKKSASTNSTKSTKASREVPANHFALSDILKKHNLDGKRVRAVLRVKMNDSHKHNAGWFFKISERATVEAQILKLMNVSK